MSDQKNLAAAFPGDFLEEKRPSFIGQNKALNVTGPQPDFNLAASALKKPVSAKVPVPTQDRVIISKLKPETTTASGLIIPSSSINEDNRGYVVATGPLVGKPFRSGHVEFIPDAATVPKVGDLVLFGQYSGTETNFEGVPYLIMREADILAILP